MSAEAVDVWMDSLLYSLSLCCVHAWLACRVLSVHASGWFEEQLHHFVSKEPVVLSVIPSTPSALLRLHRYCSNVCLCALVYMCVQSVLTDAKVTTDSLPQHHSIITAQSMLSKPSTRTTSRPLVSEGRTLLWSSHRRRYSPPPFLPYRVQLMYV